MTSLESALRASADAPTTDTAAMVPDLAPAARAAGLLDVAYSVTDAPVGRLVLAATPAGLVACSYADETTVAERLARGVSPRVLRTARPFDAVRRQLEEYFAGRRRSFDVAVDTVLAGAFGREVLRAAAAIPYGSTASYAAIAAAMGRPGAARAVGNALGANPVCVIVPCHRVLRRSGALGGYAGGLAAKELLLSLEAGASSIDQSALQPHLPR